MKKVSLNVDDIAEVDNITNINSPRARSFSENDYEALIKCYDSYIINRACPIELQGQSEVSDGTISYLNYHYENARDDLLGYINDIRRKLSPRVCLMCGGYGNGTVDHYLPRSNYGEYSVFSFNLVPACNCNGLRGNTVADSKSEKIINPYFDNLENELLYIAQFKYGPEAPAISLHAANPRHDKIDTIEFHLEHLINKTSILTWMGDELTSLSSSGYYTLRAYFPENVQIDGNILRNAIEGHVTSENHRYGTVNHWYSWFAQGLMDSPDILSYLAANAEKERLINVT